MQVVRDKLNKKTKVKSIQTDHEDEHDLQALIQENESLQLQVQNLEAQISAETNKKHVKSMTSLAYSNDEEAEFQKDIKNFQNSPTFCQNENESAHTLDIYSQGNNPHTNPHGKNTFKEMDKTTLQKKAEDQQILIVELRRKCEFEHKEKVHLEGKIRGLEGSLEKVKMENERLVNRETRKYEKTETQDRDDVDQYVHDLEIQKMELQDQFDDLRQEMTHYENLVESLQEEVDSLKSVNYKLQSCVEYPDLDIDEESTINILSQKLSEQKNEIRELKGSLSKLKSKFDTSSKQQPTKPEPPAFGNDLLNSHLTCSLGLSKNSENGRFSYIESLVHKTANSNDQNPSSSPDEMWEQAKLLNLEKVVEFFNEEIQNLMVKNSELEQTLKNTHSEYAEKLQEIVMDGITEGKADQKDGDETCCSHLDKISDLQSRISTLKQEYNEALKSSKSELKTYKAQISQFTEKFSLQQDELDELQSNLAQERTKVEILTESLNTVQASEDSQLSKFLDQNVDLCTYKSLNRKLESLLTPLHQKVHNLQKEKINLAETLVQTEEELEEIKASYEVVCQEVDELNGEFGDLEREKRKLQEVVQQMKGQVSRKNDEIRLLKSQYSASKNLFAAKITELKKLFNSKLISYEKQLYPKLSEKSNMLFEDSFRNSQSKFQNSTNLAGSLAGSVLRMSHLAQSTRGNGFDLGDTVKQIQGSENIPDLTSAFSNVISKMIDLNRENNILKMQVIKSDSLLTEESLLTQMSADLSVMHAHLKFYKNLNETDSTSPPKIHYIDQTQEFNEYDMLKQLSAKTVKLAQNEAKLAKFEKENKDLKEHGLMQDIEIEDKVNEEFKKQGKELENYSANLSSLIQDFDQKDIVQILEKQLISSKCQIETLTSKLSKYSDLNAKLNAKITEMKNVISHLETKNNGKNSNLEMIPKSEMQVLLDKIEKLKQKIADYDTERRDLLKTISDTRTQLKSQKKLIYEFKNNLGESAESICDD